MDLSLLRLLIIARHKSLHIDEIGAVFLNCYLSVYITLAITIIILLLLIW